MSKPFGKLATAKAALLVTGSTYVSFFFGLLVSAIIARGIGPADFGRYAYVVWLAGILVVVANNGLTSTGLRFISETLGKGANEAAKGVHGWLLRRQHVGVMIALGGFLVSLPLTIPPDWGMPLAVFTGVVVVSLIAKAYYIFDISAAKGHGQFAVEALSTTVLSGLNLLAVLVLFALKAPTIAYLVLFAVANIGYYMMASRMLKARRIAPTRDELEPALTARIQKHLLWTILLTLAAAFGNKASETYLLGHFVGPAEVGFFAIAAALTRGGVELLAAGLNTVLMPLMAHGYGQGGTARVHAILATSVRLFGFGGFLLAGVGFLWADVAVSLMYGEKFRDAVPVFRVMSVVAGLTLSQSAFGALLSTTDNQRIRAGVVLASVIISAVAAFVLVPRYGLQGAVVSHAVSSAIIFLVVSIGIVKVFAVPLPWRQLGGQLMAACVAAAMAGLLLLVGHALAYQFIVGIVYVIVYVLATLMFGAWLKSDAEQLQPLTARFPRLMGWLLPRIERHLRH